MHLSRVGSRDMAEGIRGGNECRGNLPKCLCKLTGCEVCVGDIYSLPHADTQTKNYGNQKAFRYVPHTSMHLCWFCSDRD